MPVLLFILPIASTLLGGFLAIRFRRFITLLIAVGAGLLLGAAFLDLLPEAIGLGVQNGLAISTVLGMMLVSYFIFYIFENALEALAQRWQSQGLERRVIGRTGAGMLIFHSFRDGLAIGAAYAASHTAGYAVAFGIAAHDLGDGMNTVILTTGGERPRTADYLFLVADALAPCVGVLLTVWWKFSPLNSVFLLVLAAGFFLHMATADFLPEIRRCRTSRIHLVPSVLLGALLIYVANLLLARYR